MPLPFGGQVEKTGIPKGVVMVGTRDANVSKRLVFVCAHHLTHTPQD
jgi:hypothetical protein